ncbi:hypothetical protein BDV34DRAFT_233690 [Aspergillus parasiticus]|uniref:Uncharacterized protein n=1 Tax=Aspergillus parasiticus TaxID=5067 RepID=A0A5N6DSU8_ASPPA|nr:hypothetical protein BDV34DRAFT_233690 [Aspergillus parasiticus]
MRERSNSWNTAQQKKKREARRKLREDRDYNPDAHREKDTERATGRASKKIKKFLMEVKNMYEGFRLEEGYPAPMLEELKQYMRWFIESTKGRLNPDGRSIIKSTLNHAENLILGFFLETGNRIPERDAAELYNWIKKDLVQDRTIKAIERQKFDLKFCDFESEQKFERGLRYEVNHLFALIPSPKFSHHSEYLTFIWDCDEPIYTGGSYLLALVIHGNALDRFSSAKDVFEQRIPEGQNELVLPWTKEAKGRCVVRHATAAKGVKALGKILIAACYYVQPTVHAMRRKLSAAYFPAHVAQILAQKSKSVYGNDYLASCSAVDVVNNTLRGRTVDKTHVEYFQGFSQFHEPGLPRRLPIDEELDLDLDPELTEKRAAFFNAKTDDDANHLLNEYKAMKRRLIVEYLLSHCRREFDVVYRPGEEPVEGQCPIKGCGQLMEQLKKQLRNKHIHTCLLQEKSCIIGIPLRHLRYCWECFIFHDKRSLEFEEHCASHILSITTQYYEVIVFRHTTIRAGYCIEYMWHESSATYRMRAFENTLVLRSHLEEHISRKTWPSKYPDPLCHHIADNEQDYRRHLHNVYHYNKTIYVRPRKLSVKRSCPELDENRATSENRHAQNERPRKIRKSHVSQPPGTGTKELKITFWEPPQPHPEAAQTEQGNQDHSNKRAYSGTIYSYPVLLR